MDYEWDEDKRLRNLSKHKVAFDRISDFNWSKAIIINRSRHRDGEPRFAGIGPIDGKLYTVIFTWRSDRIRITSLRRVNKKEEKIYEETL